MTQEPKYSLFVCEECGYRATSPNDLAMHKMMHGDAVTPYIQNADEYQSWAIKTMSGDYYAIANRLAETTGGDKFGIPLGAIRPIIDLLHAGMGLCTEAGEFMDPIKKHLMYGKPLDTDNMREELGDLLWYIAIACEALDVRMSEIMSENIEKLAKRYPSKTFTEADAQNRADKNETTD